MADVVLRDRLRTAGLTDLVEVVSAGTGGWHVGGAMDERAAALLTTRGYDPTSHRAQQFLAEWFADTDLVLAMDADNHHDVMTLAAGPAHERVRMFRDLDPLASDHDRDVPDPYFGGDEGFGQVLAMVERTADALVTLQADELDTSRAGAGG